MPTETTEVWAEEPDCRVRVEPWGGGAILTISTPWLPNPIVVSVADYRWKRIVAATTAPIDLPKRLPDDKSKTTRPSPFQHAISMAQEVHGGLQTAREWDIASTAARAAYEAAYREMAELFMERARNV